MFIGICDDSIDDRKQILDWLAVNHPSIPKTCIFEFSCGEAVIEYLIDNKLDVLFLDRRMDGLNGIETAKKIRKKDKKIKIIATTDFEGYAILGYDAEIYRYVLKKDFEKSMFDLFKKVLEEHAIFNEKTFTAKTDQGIARLLVSDIVYIESKLRKKSIFLIDQSKFAFYSKMNELEEFFVPCGFVRPHNSFLINSSFVKRFSNNEIILHSNITIPMSRKLAREAYSRLMELLS